VHHTLGGLLLAEITRRTPVTHWGKNCRFGDGSARDAFQDYFEPVSAVSVADIVQIGDATFFPPKWTADNLPEAIVSKWAGAGARLGAVEFLNRQATIAVVDYYIGVVNAAAWLPAHHDMVEKRLGGHLRLPCQKISSSARRRPFALRRILPGKSGRHTVRGRTHAGGPTRSRRKAILAPPIRKFWPRWMRFHRISGFFQLTDDENHLSLMKSRYGDRVVATQCQRTSTITGIQYLPSTDGGLAGLEIMTDSYLQLSRAACRQIRRQRPLQRGGDDRDHAERPCRRLHAFGRQRVDQTKPPCLLRSECQWCYRFLDHVGTFPPAGA
jgi:hypothetical protein